ncbi:MAG: heterodisulfide reductase-related iron-sulfur binding cluster, partial [Candidatus Puniceispirillaceae bacterium]
IDPEINAATLRLLRRLGVEVLVRQRASCCGALAHHIDAHDAAHQQICATIDAWRPEMESGTIDAIIVNTSGCGTTLKDYGNLMRDDAEYADIAAKISALACDVTELLDRVEMGQSVAPRGLSVAYHSACSMQHGQKITELPKQLLSRAGFDIKAIANAHLCCGSAGVYNVLQPDLSQGLKERKLASINKAGADIVAAGNLGCINQLADVDAPICHTVQLLDWAYGGPTPSQLDKIINQS